MKRNPLLPVLLLYFIDNFSLAIVSPIFATLFLTKEFSFVPDSFHLSERMTLYRVASLAFLIALLIGAPIMGYLSDKFGRKKIFSITISATILTSLLTGFSIWLDNYILLIFLRTLSGFFSGNLSICLAAISDISPEEESRAKNFGALTAISGLSWILALLTAGDVFGASIPPQTAFFVVAALGVINLIILKRFYYDPEQPLLDTKIKIKTLLSQIFEAFFTRSVRFLFLIQSLFLLGWHLIFQGFSSYSITAYNSRIQETALSLIFIGLLWILGATVVNRQLIKRFQLNKIPLIGLILLFFLILYGSFTHSYLPLVITDCSIALITAFTSVMFYSLISLSSSPEIQGRIMGLSQSVSTLVQIAVPLIGIALPNRGYVQLYRTAAISILSALLLFIFLEYKKRGTPGGI